MLVRAGRGVPSGGQGDGAVRRREPSPTTPTPTRGWSCRYSDGSGALCRGTPDPIRVLWLFGTARRPARAPAGPGPGPGPPGDVPGLLPIRGRLEVRAGPGRARSRLALRGVRHHSGGAVAGPPGRASERQASLFAPAGVRVAMLSMLPRQLPALVGGQRANARGRRCSVPARANARGRRCSVPARFVEIRAAGLSESITVGAVPVGGSGS